MENDSISRQAAIDAKQEFRNPNVVRDTEARTAYDRTYANGWNDCNSAWINAIKALPSAQPEQRWIPCSERLPEYGEAVLTINKDEEYEINHIIDEDDGEWFLDGVIAWMPLPGPYRAERRTDGSD